MAETGAPSPPAGSSARRQAAGAALEMSSGAALALGALTALCWLGALTLDLQTTPWPGWARQAPHAALVLAVPVLIVLIGRRHRLSVPRTVLVLLALIVVSLLALLPITTSSDLLSFPVCVPSLGFGVALGAIVPFRRSADWSTKVRYSAATVAGAGSALVVGLAVSVLDRIAVSPPVCTGPGAMVCGLYGILDIPFFVLFLLLTVGAAALSGGIGSALARSRR